MALDRDPAINPNCVAMALDRLGFERELSGLSVEKVRGQQVCLEIRVLDLHRRPPWRSPLSTPPLTVASNSLEVPVNVPAM